MSEGAAPAPGGYVDAGGVRTYYEVQGSGEPLIFLHGGFATIETWRGQADVFDERYHAHLPNGEAMAGHPMSRGP